MATEPCPECGYESGHRESCPGYYNDSPTDDKPDDKPTPRCNRCRGNPHIGACHDKPPDRAEWEQALNDAEICTDLNHNNRYHADKIRAAVQRALDEREAATRREDVESIRATIGFAQGVKWRNLADLLERIAAAAAAKARARKPNAP